MLDFRSHRLRPYELNPVSRRSRQPGSHRTTSLSSSSTSSPSIHGYQSTMALRYSSRQRLRLFRNTHKQHFQQQEVHMLEQPNEGQEIDVMGTTMAMDTSVDADVNTSKDEDIELEMIQEPAIFRLSQELLALIFHYVYVTPVVLRPEQHSGELNSSQTSTTSLTHSSSSTFHSTTNETTSTASTTATTSTITTTSEPSRTNRRNKRDKRKSIACIQNDLPSVLALCLTCRTFYPQAIRLLWRQRTLASYDDLIEFYRAIDFSASLRRRQQKQRQLEQEQLQRLGMDYSTEEGLFNNEAALRIKSLTLLDMSFGSFFLPSLPSLAMTASSTDTTTTLTSSSQFFGSSSNSNMAQGNGSNSHHVNALMSAGAGSELRQGIDGLKTIDENSMIMGFAKDDMMTVSSSSSSPTSGSTSRGPSSSSTQLKRRSRQKSTSIYSELISPRLLHTIANHCYALVDLKICMDNKSLAAAGSPTFIPNSTETSKVQPSIPFSIIAGALLSLKRLTLMGVVCHPGQNKTGAELLLFAQKSQPLERLSIRSCRGISLETYIEFAVRSNRRLLSVDFEGLDFESSEQLTEMISAYAAHCENIMSITLSCLHGLALDGMIAALASHKLEALQELHVLGHDSFHAPQQQQQQQQQQQEPQQEPQPQPEQQQQENNNHENNNQEGAQVPMTQMCHLADANQAMADLAQLPPHRLTLYCLGITDIALFQFLCKSPHLIDLVLSEPTTILHLPQFQTFVKSVLPSPSSQSQAEQPSAMEDEENPFGPPVSSTATATPFTSAGFLNLILARCSWLKYMFMKLSLETAQEWIVQPCFKEAGLDKCLYQYRTATGAPAVVMMWDTRNKVNATLTRS
ncbi:hypothetical protein BX616_010636, partial [Lobosporangium transversale]|uniref:Uncharacterized protein n=1 Tax=Lobosporangium transversale TaxID=64571 RepID=A0A1Y2GGE9_9FUNG|eukprot:XP_021879155.1 hypothetical protein BCR41DRAFT_423990 [Lobosporangium transversale]